MNTTREQIIETTCELLETYGYHATGLNQILAKSRTPKGSLYYYFPEGKEELTAQAIERMGQHVARNIKNELSKSTDPSEAIRSLVHVFANRIEASGFCAGGPLMIVAMETATSSERLNLACREAYHQLQKTYQEQLIANGFIETQAEQLAKFIMASVEGGIILSRTNHSGDPLRNVANMLGHLINSYPRQ
jgi:TetR/AcrR family transcriptional regulator, lmrAB and yxaGH operons repressor